MFHKPERIGTLDLLRGLCVLFACLQHYGGHLIVWYTSFFRETAFTDGLYAGHADLIGRSLAADVAGQWVTRLTVPWLSLLYIALAAFNLGLRDQKAFAAAFPDKLKAFGVMFILFTGESLIVSVTTGHGLSFSPLQAWMVILSLIAIVYRYLGVRGVAAMGVLSFARFALPVASWNAAFEAWVRTWLHPQYRLDAELDLFLPAASLGFVYGWVFHQRPALRRRLYAALAGIAAVGIVIYLASGRSAPANPLNVYEHERLGNELVPMLGILGVHALTFLLALGLHARGYAGRVPVLSWLGVASLSVFFFHRIVFIHVYMPLRELVANWAGLPISVTMPELFAAVIFMLAVVAWLMRSGALLLLAGAPKPAQRS